MPETTQTHPEVRPGQIWADNDVRSRGRQIKVLAVVDGKATCTVVRAADPVASNAGRPPAGRVTRISQRRFRPNSTGYRLVQDAEAATKQG